MNVCDFFFLCVCEHASFRWTKTTKINSTFFSTFQSFGPVCRGKFGMVNKINEFQQYNKNSQKEYFSFYDWKNNRSSVYMILLRQSK